LIVLGAKLQLAQNKMNHLQKSETITHTRSTRGRHKQERESSRDAPAGERGRGHGDRTSSEPRIPVSHSVQPRLYALDRPADVNLGRMGEVESALAVVVALMDYHGRARRMLSEGLGVVDLNR
jgi:hypothetical protein